jgi:hypothetical protein
MPFYRFRPAYVGLVPTATENAQVLRELSNPDDPSRDPARTVVLLPDHTFPRETGQVAIITHERDGTTFERDEAVEYAVRVSHIVAGEDAEEAPASTEATHGFGFDQANEGVR